MTNSRAKGARVEREAAKFLTSIGFPAERNARNGKSTDDLVVPSLPGVHFEVKGDRSIGVGTKALDDAMDQAMEAAAGHQVPVVLWKEHRKGWRLSFVPWIDGEIATVGESDIEHRLRRINEQDARDGAGKE